MDFDRNVLRLSVVYGVLFGAFAVIFPFLPIYLDTLGYSPSRIGLLLGIMELSGLAAPLLLSRSADRSGRFRTSIGFILMMSAFSLFLIHRMSRFSAVMAAAALFGFFYKPIFPMMDALSGRALVNAPRDYGRARVWGTVGFILVSLLLQASALFEGADARFFFIAFMAAFAVKAGSMPLAPAALPHEVDGAPEASSRVPTAYIRFLAVGFLGNIGFSLYRSFGSLYFAEIVGVHRVSGMFVAAAIAELPILYFGGRFLMRLGHRRMLIIAQLSILLRLSLLAFLPYALPVLLSQLTHAFCYGFYLIAGVDWVNRTIGPKKRALGMGMFMAISYSGSQFIGSIVGGFLLETGGFGLLFGSGILFPAAGLIWIMADPRIASFDHLDAGGGNSLPFGTSRSDK
jgi:PPP family 3-phenylpropionic acid transporter